MHKHTLSLFLFSLYCLILFPVQAQIAIRWLPLYAENVSDSVKNIYPVCEGCFTNPENGLPVFSGTIPVDNASLRAEFYNLTYTEATPAELPAVQRAGVLPAEAIFSQQIITDRGRQMIRYTVQPFRQQQGQTTASKLTGFSYRLVPSAENANPSNREKASAASSSVLAGGDWYRVSVDRSGICQLTYADLKAMGLSLTGVSSANLQVRGYGGMLPERAGDARYDDLPEVALKVVDGGDGTFDPGDFLLFYAQGPNRWKFNPLSGLFEFQPHLYSRYAFYYIGVSANGGIRMASLPVPETEPVTTVNSYNWFDAASPREVNLIKSGRGWFGDLFDVVSERSYTFANYEPENNTPLYVRLSAVARSTQTSSFTLTAGGKTFSLFVSPIVTDFNTAYAKMATETFEVVQPSVGSPIKLKYNKTTGSGLGWLNFMELNATARLTFTGGQTQFRRTGLQGVVDYHIAGATPVEQIFDVTDPLHPALIQFSQTGSGLAFRALADTLREYLICDNKSYIKPVFVEKTANQNLHAMLPPDLLIIAHPDFMDQAMRLATFHASHDDLSVSVVQPQAIYNEFSSGAQDISALRDFVRLLYNRSGSQRNPRYLLLFGDASYDPLDRISGNTNFIPCYQSPESLHPVTSYVTDDFFASLDYNEGGLASDVPDIGVGRLPVKSVAEAEMAVDKVIHYTTASAAVQGDWRNSIVFVADDGDGNSHMQQGDMLATEIDTTFSSYNVDKIFFDAYPQISTPGGQRIPDATAAINQRMDKGALIINYTGHGGETGWALERVLEVADINSWTNYDRMPVFMTATCEFSRFDDPRLTSAGELVFLNPKGGGVALFTTSRPTFGAPNFTLASSFYGQAFTPLPGTGMPRLGDLIRSSKLGAGADNNSKKFVLLGDPAMRMAYPEYTVNTVMINGRSVSEAADTLKALSEITISGIITDHNGNLIPDFNGTVLPSVYDKESQVQTFGTEYSSPMTFSLRRNIIYKGKVQAENGAFTFSFIVPRDIAYQFGKGKISYYASDGERDASGFYNDVVVGGFSQRTLEDTDGPEVSLFMNDTLFRAGGFTDENPVMLAYVRDLSGINTIGNGIGHDVVAILDEDTGNPYILNDFYQSDLNTFRSGQIAFPFHDLAEGPHSLRLKVWDVNNNSSEVSITFVVAGSNGLSLGEATAWPNPMHDKVTIDIEHNQAGHSLNLSLDVFTLSGEKAASLKRTIFAGGFRSIAFEWDGRGSNGERLSPGFYIGRLRLINESGLSAEKSVKLIIAR